MNGYNFDFCVQNMIKEVAKKNNVPQDEMVCTWIFERLLIERAKTTPVSIQPAAQAAQKPKGFGALTQERRREIALKGAQAAKEKALEAKRSPVKKKRSRSSQPSPQS